MKIIGYCLRLEQRRVKEFAEVEPGESRHVQTPFNKCRSARTDPSQSDRINEEAHQQQAEVDAQHQSE